MTLNNLLLHYSQVQYSAVISYQTSDGDSSYVDSFEMTTSDTSYVFTMLTPSNEYRFTVTSYTKDGESSNKDLKQTTMNGRDGNNNSKLYLCCLNYLLLQKILLLWKFALLLK